MHVNATRRTSNATGIAQRKIPKSIALVCSAKQALVIGEYLKSPVGNASTCGP